MPVNVEIKARARDWQHQLERAGALADSREELVQEDIFFACRRGRLKLRLLGGEQGQLIFYDRTDTPEPKTSSYEVTPVENPQALHRILTGALDEIGKVRKRRIVLLVGHVRIHFDEVENLGRFIELEITLGEGRSEREGHELADGYMRELGIEPDDLLAGAYIDMLLRL